MRTFRATTLQDNDIPWLCWDDTEQTRTRTVVWGETLIPSPHYASYTSDGPPMPIGQPDYYEWQALLPDGYQFPDWITEITT